MKVMQKDIQNSFKKLRSQEYHQIIIIIIIFLYLHNNPYNDNAYYYYLSEITSWPELRTNLLNNNTEVTI